jgi:hypothetical protein
VTDIAILAPNCTTVTLVDGDPATLGEGAAVRFACAAAGGSMRGSTVYGTDELGLGVIGSEG